MEAILMRKLNTGFENIKKAFLALDSDKDGYIDSEDLAKYMKNATTTGDDDGKKGLNFTILELMIKLRCKVQDARINYN